MGPRHLILSVLPLLLATPAFAQQESNSSDPVFNLPQTTPPPADDPRRQGPELDVFRGTATPTPVRTPPPIIVPTVTPKATPAPVPTQMPASRPAPTKEPRAERPTPPPPVETPAATVPDNSANAAAPAVEPIPLPIPADNAAPAEVVAPGTTPWPWIAAGLAALAAIAAAVFLRRRRPQVTEDTILDAPAPAAPQPEPEPIAPPVASPPPPPPAPVVESSDRPWIDMALDIGVARYSLIGVTVGYVLILHNRGERPAQDILVRGLLGNAGAQQEELLRHFFSGETGLPLHSAVTIAPGETIRITGELRLATDQIVPVPMGNRTLLVPLAAFDAHYRWADEQDAPQGSGRTGRAFILGQEQEPPTDRLAPFRLDQGPRQYPKPAARAAAELPPA